MDMQNFQAACVTLFWPEWSRLLGVFVASTIGVAMYHILTSYTPARTRRSTRFAGQKISE
jgi:hypothetical protein